MSIEDFNVLVATEEHTPFAQAICDEMAESAKARGTGIAKRTPEYVANKMRAGKAVIAFHKDGTGRFQLHRVLGTWRLCRQFGFDYQSEIPQAGFGQSHQDRDIFPVAPRCSKVLSCSV